MIYNYEVKACICCDQCANNYLVAPDRALLPETPSALTLLGHLVKTRPRYDL